MMELSTSFAIVSSLRAVVETTPNVVLSNENNLLHSVRNFDNPISKHSIIGAEAYICAQSLYGDKFSEPCDDLSTLPLGNYTFTVEQDSASVWYIGEKVTVGWIINSTEKHVYFIGKIYIADVCCHTNIGEKVLTLPNVIQQARLTGTPNQRFTTEVATSQGITTAQPAKSIEDPAKSIEDHIIEYLKFKDELTALDKKYGITGAQLQGVTFNKKAVPSSCLVDDSLRIRNDRNNIYDEIMTLSCQRTSPVKSTSETNKIKTRIEDPQLEASHFLSLSTFNISTLKTREERDKIMATKPTKKWCGPRVMNLKLNI